jgi:hypothetical protein
MSLIDTLYTTYQRHRPRRNAHIHLPKVNYISVNADYDIKSIVVNYSLDTVIYFGRLSPSSIINKYSPDTLAYDVADPDAYRWLMRYLQSHEVGEQSTLIVVDEYVDKALEAAFINLCNTYSVNLLIRQPIMK